MTLIDNYAALPLGKWEEIQRIAGDVTRDDLERQAAVIGVLTGGSEATALKMPIGEYAECARAAAFLGEPLSVEAVPERLADKYRVGTFGLVPVTDIRKLTAAQYIDFQELAREWAEHVPEVLTCFLVPEGREYNEGYDIAEVAAAIREAMSVKEAFGLLAFFFGAFGRSMTDTLNSSGEELKRARTRERTNG